MPAGQEATTPRPTSPRSVRGALGNGLAWRIALVGIASAIVTAGILGVGVWVVGGETFMRIMATYGEMAEDASVMFSESIGNVLVVALALAVLASVLLAVILSRRIAQPLAQVGAAARRVAGGDLATRVPRPAPDEAWKFYPRRYHAYQPVKNGRSEGSQQSSLREALKRSVLEDAFGYPPADGKQPPSGAIFSNPIARRLASRMFQSTFESIGIAPYSGRHRILDVGCGSGAYVARMGRLGWEAHGLEMNPDAARYAREQLEILIRKFENENEAYTSLNLSMWSNRYGSYDDLARIKEWSAAGGLGIEEW